MPRNVSDQEEAYWRGRAQVADFVESIYQDPALNKEAKRLIKKKYPQLQIPDYDIREEIDARFAEEKRLRDEVEAAERQKKDDEAWRNTRSATQKKYGLTDEALKDMEDWMVKEHVGNYEVAASHRVIKNPKPSEAGFDTTRWHHEKQPGWQDIAKDPEGWARNEIMGAIHRDAAKARGE